MKYLENTLKDIKGHPKAIYKYDELDHTMTKYTIDSPIGYTMYFNDYNQREKFIHDCKDFKEISKSQADFILFYWKRHHQYIRNKKMEA